MLWSPKKNLDTNNNGYPQTNNNTNSVYFDPYLAAAAASADQQYRLQVSDRAY